MTDRLIPRPVSGTDFRLDALIEEIRGLRADLAARQPQPEPLPDGEIELREADDVGTPLPDDFPGKLALEEAGIVYLETVPRDGDQLIAIKGIGRVTAGQILTWLSQ